MRLAYRVTYHDNRRATVREGGWARLPPKDVQIVDVVEVKKGNRRIVARLAGFDFYFVGDDRFGGWHNDPARFAAPDRTPPMEPMPAREREILLLAGIDPLYLDTVPGGTPGELWRITAQGSAEYVGPIRMFPKGRRPPEARRTSAKTGRLIDDDKASVLGLAIRWREWLAREGRA